MFLHHLLLMYQWMYLTKARQVLKNWIHFCTQMHPICPVLRKLWLANLYGIITYHLTTKTSSLMVLSQVTPGLTVLPQVILHVCDWMHTDINHFGLLHEYPDQPSYDPNSTVHFEDVSNYYKVWTPQNQS